MKSLESIVEKMNWVDPAIEMPDEEITVLVFVPSADEPVWPAYLCDGQWRWSTASSITGDVVAWAEMPKGPEVGQ